MKPDTVIDDIKALFETLDFESRVQVFLWMKRQMDYPDQDPSAIKRQIRQLARRLPLSEVINALMDNNTTNSSVN